MTTRLRGFTSVVLMSAFAIGQGSAQSGVPEKHAAEKELIRKMLAAPPISESALCQKTNPNGGVHVHLRIVHPEDLESDLLGLMRKSDEVVMVGEFGMGVRFPSPNEQDVVTYYDAKVLRSWKGSYRAGDLINFALPRGYIGCKNGSSVRTVTSQDQRDDFGYGSGPLVLFLRHSEGDDALLIPGLMLTGGDGMQGSFSLHTSEKRKSGESRSTNCACAAMDPRLILGNPNRYSGCVAGVDYISRCNQDVDADRQPVAQDFIDGPLQEKYMGMPVADFLLEVQSLAGGIDSSASTQQVSGESGRQ